MFLSNFIGNGDRMCLGWGWYLQVDFQLFVMGVLLIYLYSKKQWVFLLVTGMLTVGSLGFNFVWTFVEEIRIFTDIQAFIKFQSFMQNLYIKPYSRCVPYLMGFLIGIFIMEYRSNYHFRQSQSKIENL